VAKKTQTGRDSSRSSEKRRPPASRRRMMQVSYTLPFQRQHFILFSLVLCTILAGFIALGFESITFAPLLMVTGYCIGIPFLLLWENDRNSEEESSS